MTMAMIGGGHMDVRPYRIEPAKARQTIEAGQAIVLDLTSPFITGAVRGRIPGAVTVSPREILRANTASDVVQRLPELTRDKTIIAYCTCPDDEASARLTRVLRHEGYEAWTLDGGLPAWRAAGYPMEAKLAA
jgi:rhodanese-related sulfurtransferase